MEPHAPKLKLPKIIIYGVSKEFSRKQLTKKIVSQNKCLSEGFDLKLSIKGKSGLTHWVAEITPTKLGETHKRGKITMGWSVHSFTDYV